MKKISTTLVALALSSTVFAWGSSDFLPLHSGQAVRDLVSGQWAKVSQIDSDGKIWILPPPYSSAASKPGGDVQKLRSRDQVAVYFQPWKGEKYKQYDKETAINYKGFKCKFWVIYENDSADIECHDDYKYNYFFYDLVPFSKLGFKTDSIQNFRIGDHICYHNYSDNKDEKRTGQIEALYTNGQAYINDDNFFHYLFTDQGGIHRPIKYIGNSCETLPPLPPIPPPATDWDGSPHHN